MIRNNKNLPRIVLLSLVVLLGFGSLFIATQYPPKVHLNEKLVHISFDDVYEVLKDITDNENEYENVFDNKFLGTLKKMNDNYGAKFTLNLYERYPEKGWDIAKTSVKYKGEFIENSGWLKFCFHSIEPTTSFDDETSIDEFERSFEKVNNAIENFASKESIAKVLRLNYFKGNAEKIKYLSEQGVIGLLCSDDDRISYDLSGEQHKELKAKEQLQLNNMTYYDTDFRFDGKRMITHDMMKLRDQEILVLFAHEWALGRRGLNRMETAVKWLVKNDYEISFLE